MLIKTLDNNLVGVDDIVLKTNNIAFGTIQDEYNGCKYEIGDKIPFDKKTKKEVPKWMSAFLLIGGTGSAFKIETEDSYIKAYMHKSQRKWFKQEFVPSENCIIMDKKVDGVEYTYTVSNFEEICKYR